MQLCYVHQSEQGVEVQTATTRWQRSNGGRFRLRKSPARNSWRSSQFVVGTLLITLPVACDIDADILARKADGLEGHKAAEDFCQLCPLGLGGAWEHVRSVMFML